MSEQKDLNLEIRKIQEALNAEVCVGEALLDEKVVEIYASDLMSDVLAWGRADSCLLTGLNTVQSAISSHMADFKAIVFLRGKVPGQDICKFAEVRDLILLTTKLDMFDACIKIAQIDGILLAETSAPPVHEHDDSVTKHEFHIDGKDFASAGLVSTGIKSILKKIGYDMHLIRRIAISVYEGEMNVVMHAKKADVTLMAGDNDIKIILDDEGKGIPDIDKAMQKGYSTATEEQRAMGFGAGMGLPNIDKNSDHLKIDSTVGKGTRLEMTFQVNK